jgi:hypothetical protein
VIDSRRLRIHLASALLWAVAAFLLVGGFAVHNDHFDRLSRARQLARFGELPLRDFFDPGYFGAVLASATLQRMLGDNLLGELLLNTTFIATGTVLVLHLATRLSGSLLVGLIAASLALVTMPRSYDYDKVLFFPLGMALCWRYLDTRRPRELVLLAAGLVCGALFRYDTGVYVAAGAFVAIVAAHAGDWRIVSRRVGMLSVATAAWAAPVLAFIALQGGGLGDAADQVVMFATREAARTAIARPPAIDIEGPLFALGRVPPPASTVNVRWADGVTPQIRRELEARYHLGTGRIEGPAGGATWAYAIQDPSTDNVRALVSDPRVEDTHFIDRATFEVTNSERLSSRIRRRVPWLRMEIVPGLWNNANAAPILYYVLILTPLAAAALLVAWRRRPDVRHDAPYLWSLIAVCVLLDIFILRDPIEARVGGIAGTAAVLAAWLYSRVRSRLLAIPVLAALAVVTWSLSVVGSWNQSVAPTFSDWRRIPRTFAAVSATPPPLSLVQSGRIEGLVAYLRECTKERDRIWVASFVPEIYFFSQRGFAAGLPVTFGGHWSELRFQRRSIAVLTRRPAALILLPEGDIGYLLHVYPFLMEHVRTHYVDVGTSGFGSSASAERFRILIPRERRPLQRTHASTGLPCF